jgi:riboflavin synthase
MFSGIIEEKGVVQEIECRKNLFSLRIKGRTTLRGTRAGDSISVNGVCLTVTVVRRGIFAFDLMRETLLKTSLGKIQKGDHVNLERALKVEGRLNGHFVMGHVDAVGVVNERMEEENYTELRISLPKGLSPYIAPKGSICLDGVSLTVGAVTKAYFSVYLIPFTKEVTTLGDKSRGDTVNIEVDILARYIQAQSDASAI